MKIKTESSTKKKTQLLCCFVLENSNKTLGLGKLNIIPVPGKKHAQRILLAGLGRKENLTKDTIRLVSGKIAQKARELKLEEFSIITPPSFSTIQLYDISRSI